MCSYSASVSVLLLVTGQLVRTACFGGLAWGLVAWLRAVPEEPGLPTAEQLALLPHEVLAERLAEAYRLIAGLTTRVEALERQLGKSSSTSSRPPSSDSPFRKKPQDRSLREKGKRPPGKQPGEPGTTMRLVDGPDERLCFPPARCLGCGELRVRPPEVMQPARCVWHPFQVPAGPLMAAIP